MSLIASVREELVARKGDWPDICRQTEIPYSWLTKFAQGTLTNPGAVRLEMLEQHFEAHPRIPPEPTPTPSTEPQVAA